MSSSTWQVHFKDRLDGLVPPPEGSLLESALLQSRLSEEEYFDWALKNETAPHLRAEFFTAQTPKPELLQKISGPWGTLLFPVAEWDGHFIIAGIERPSELPEHCTFVYASLKSLTGWWELLQNNHEPTEAPDGISEISEPTNLSFAGVALASNSFPANDMAEKTETPSAPEVVTPVLASAEVPLKSTGPINAASEAPAHLLTGLTATGDQFKNEISAVFKALDGLYDKVMFLALSENGESFVPLFWSDSFGKPANSNPIPTTGASLFSLVLHTEKPFHGPVSPSDVNDLFFKNWNGGETAPTATLVPFLYKGNLTGILLGLGNAELYRSTVLRQIEATCQALAQNLGSKDAEPAAA